MNQEQQENGNFNASYVNNMGYTGESILKIRLDTQQLLQQIEYFLKGKAVRIRINEQGLAEEEVLEVGDPLANDKGVHAILSYASATINSQTVQGNYEWDHWREEVSWMREQLATDVFVNYDMWEIDPQNISIICNTVMNMIKPFLTRLVNNEERKSYSNYSESRNMAPPQKKGMLASIFSN